MVGWKAYSRSVNRLNVKGWCNRCINGLHGSAVSDHDVPKMQATFDTAYIRIPPKSQKQVNAQAQFCRLIFISRIYADFICSNSRIVTVFHSSLSTISLYSSSCRRDSTDERLRYTSTTRRLKLSTSAARDEVILSGRPRQHVPRWAGEQRSPLVVRTTSGERCLVH